MTNDRRDAIEIVKMMVQAPFSLHTPTEDMVRKSIDALAPTYGLDDVAATQVFDEICEAMNVRMDIGIAIEAKGHKPWLGTRAPTWNLWKAYYEILASEGRNHQVLGTLDSTLNRIIDHLGDPEDAASWARRALVIGEVQSGKTSTYIGLIDKAIDVGYRVIVLLGGHTELLRRQTQDRVDFGVIGRDTSSAKKHAASGNLIGVGKRTDTTFIDSLTTQIYDFRKTSFEAASIVPGPEKVVVFVAKKNKTVLDRVEQWFAEAPPATANLPVLVIDDESDYASVNTNDPDKDPTAINAAIRSILALFNRSSYVAFTATPFANIFIDDDADDDLFPRDLIYALDSPTNYCGCDRFFSAETELDPIRTLDDAADFFPLGHKRSLVVTQLPESLVEAIRCYLLTNAIRDLRGQDGSPTSMLVNVSRFVDVQQHVFDLVDSAVKRYRNAIEMHADEFGSGVPNASLEQIRATFEREFQESGVTWNSVLNALRRANHDVETVIMNARTVKRDAMPTRHVSVGGDLLSRGLTLEGLSTSYFYRRTQAADTLMQMGRWFGYRPGYEDICRVWITEEMRSAYTHSLTTLENLRLDLEEMQRQRLTPKDFGISVRLHPDALAITARNKMRAGTVHVGSPTAISLRGTVNESTRLSSSNSDLESNVRLVHEMLAALPANRTEPERIGSRLIWRRVNKDVVATFLRGFKVQPNWSQRLFEGAALADFVSRAHAEDLQTWDIVVAGGSGAPTDGYGLDEFPSWTPPIRSFGGSPQEGWIVSGRRMRILGPGDVATTLLSTVRKQAEEDYRALDGNADKKSVPDGAFTRHLERPVLFVFPIRPREEAGAPLPARGTPLVAVAVAVPGERSERGDDTVKYLLNAPAQRLWDPDFVSDLEDEGEGEDDD